jgi:hypothetical protein
MLMLGLVRDCVVKGGRLDVDGYWTLLRGFFIFSCWAGRREARFLMVHVGIKWVIGLGWERYLRVMKDVMRGVSGLLSTGLFSHSLVLLLRLFPCRLLLE